MTLPVALGEEVGKFDGAIHPLFTTTREQHQLLAPLFLINGGLTDYGKGVRCMSK